jgi:phosphatidylserine/phosphatidylglycerophosphate/cardiolipin synthase-like enzyme
MAAETIYPPRSQAPPDALVNRTAAVATKVLNTVRVPTDRFEDAKAAWFRTGNDMPGVMEGNRVKFMIDAAASQFRSTSTGAFHDMVMAIRTATQPGHFIYVASWYCDVTFEIESGVTLAKLLTQASQNGVMIRGMFWKSYFGEAQNEDAVNFFNSVEKRVAPQGIEFVKRNPVLENAAAIWDERGNEPEIPFVKHLPVFGHIPRHVGTQHQKILCVYGEQGLICFCGGVEFNPDRIETPHRPTGFKEHFRHATGSGGPLHDLHCRIEGPASFHLVNVFWQRWWDHPDRHKIEDPKPGGGGKPPLIVPTFPETAGDQIVQVGRTFSKDEYGFARGGETTAAKVIEHAIRNAKRYIYTEDQYFVGGFPFLEDALLDAIPRIEHFTAVITFWTMTSMPFVNHHRRRFIQKLQAKDREKVRIFAIQPFPASNKDKSKDFYDGFEPHTYVHTKAWIIDDEFASIGSINTNRRGWSHDCEVVAGIYERSTDRFLHYRFAHWLRIELWKEHLGMLDPVQEAELADGVASAVHWLRRPESARVRPYDLNETDSSGENDLRLPIPIPVVQTLFFRDNETVWDHFVDPE